MSATKFVLFQLHFILQFLANFVSIFFANFLCKHLEFFISMEMILVSAAGVCKTSFYLFRRQLRCACQRAYENENA